MIPPSDPYPTTRGSPAVSNLHTKREQRTRHPLTFDLIGIFHQLVRLFFACIPMSTASPQIRRRVYDADMNPNSISWLIAGIAGFAAVLMAVALLRGRSGRDDVYRNTLLQRISKQLDALDHIGKQVEGLDRAFRIPRIRGGFGETMLEELLRFMASLRIMECSIHVPRRSKGGCGYPDGLPIGSRSTQNSRWSEWKHGWRMTMPGCPEMSDVR
jgi:hypothetical protein